MWDGDDYAQLFQLHDSDVEEWLDGVKSDGEKLAACPNYWVPRSSLDAPEDAQKRIHAELLHPGDVRLTIGLANSRAVYHLRVAPHAQEYEAGRGLAFHFDKDEHAMAQRGQMCHPQFSSIVYLTGSGDTQRQGPTVVLRQRFDNTSRKAIPEDPEDCVIVFPRRGNFLVFDGALGHGVLDSVTHDTRMTLLINWWTHKPENIDIASSDELQQRGLEPLDRTPARAQIEGGSLKIMPCPGPDVITVAEAEDAVQQVDDLLAQSNIKVLGDRAHDWFAVSHAGMSLYPIADQLLEAGDEASCAAAFVPLSMLARSDSEGSEDEQ